MKRSIMVSDRVWKIGQTESGCEKPATWLRERLDEGIQQYLDDRTSQYLHPTADTEYVFNLQYQDQWDDIGITEFELYAHDDARNLLGKWIAHMGEEKVLKGFQSSNFDSPMAWLVKQAQKTKQ